MGTRRHLLRNTCRGYSGQKCARRPDWRLKALSIGDLGPIHIFVGTLDLPIPTVSPLLYPIAVDSNSSRSTPPPLSTLGNQAGVVSLTLHTRL